MKKKSLWAIIALAGLTISSCTNDEVIPNTSADNAIEFGTYVGRDAQTRGEILTTDGLKTKGFGVYAYYTNDGKYNSTTATPNFMNNTKVTHNGTYWEYSPIKYWPNEKTDYVSFFAYAPYNAYNVATTVPTPGDPIIEYTVDTDVTKHVDLTVAGSILDQQKQNVDGTVNFTFKHALSRVGFKVEAVIDEGNQANGNTDENTNHNPIANQTTISVQEVELYGNFNHNAKLNLKTAIWEAQISHQTSYKLEYSDFVSGVADNVNNSPQILNKDDEFMMLIPTGTIATKIRVKYTVTTTDESLAGDKSVIVNDITSDDISFTFAQGKAYYFVLHLGLTSVKLSATVNDWDEASNIVVNVPLNEVPQY